VSAESGAFKTIRCRWLGPQGAEEVNSFADVKRLTAEWDGEEPSVDAWNTARMALENQVARWSSNLQGERRQSMTRKSSNSQKPRGSGLSKSWGGCSSATLLASTT
jgi:hypothetical protein